MTVTARGRGDRARLRFDPRTFRSRVVLLEWWQLQDIKRSTVLHSGDPDTLASDRPR